MLAARHQPQAEARLIERDVRDHDGQHGNQHEPVELEAVDVQKEGLLGLDILNGGGDVIGVCGGVERLYKDSRARSTEQVHRRADQRLIGLEIDAGDAEKRRICNAEHDRTEKNGQNEQNAGGMTLQCAHDECAAQCADDHDALKTEVDDAGMLGEAAAERDQNEDGGKNQSILNKQQHYATPPLPLRAADAERSLLRVIMPFMTFLRKSTNAQR